MDDKSKLTGRRQFIGDAAALGLMGALGTGAILSSCTSQKQKYEAPVFPEIAPDGPVLKAGLIGCGGRGTGAAINFINAGPNLQITALADVFQDRIDRCRETIKKSHNVEIPDENCFVGFDAYKRVIESGVDVIIEASATHFRPRHFEAAVQARKHCFIEKPAAVDPVGVRKVIASGKMAEAAGLTVVAGTQRRHQADYNKTFSMIKNGAIGDLISANCYYNRGGAGYFTRQEGWSDMEAMIRNRANWIWLTGDNVVNLLVHNLDVLNWFFEKHPVKASGFGARIHRPTGDMYDFFSVDFVFDDEKRYQGMCREMDGCTNNVSDIIFGTGGYTNCQNKIFDYNDNIIWEYEYPLGEDGRPTNRTAISPYDQEMINFVTAVRSNKPVNEVEELANSTITGIMGRESAYSGKDVTWEETMNSDLRLGPEEYNWGSVDIPTLSPLPGKAPVV
ncbi:MAG: Gfo/Idh/MocA family oxidoreductase [Mariniphaga sp.]|nr:Gfo/Idh/MocA family oxidoreductase [Mariniphaga sp.]